MKRLITIVCVASAAALLCLGTTTAVPRLVNYQGILTDDTGALVTGTHDLTFAIYPDSGQSAPLYWTETHLGVQVDAGLFNVILGGVVEIPDSIFAGGDRWLGITVDAGSEMSPRMQITSVPWAFRAASADSAGDVGWSTISGMPAGFADGVDDVGSGSGDGHSLDAADGSPTDMVYVNNDGQVQIKTVSDHYTHWKSWGTIWTNCGVQMREGADLHLRGDDGIGSIAFVRESDSKQMAGMWIPGGSSPKPGLYFSEADATPDMVIDSTGNVGIGTTDPIQPLHVKGDGAALALEGDTHTSLAWYPDGESAGRKGWIGWENPSATEFTIRNEMGPVKIQNQVEVTNALGIGTSTPTHKLHMEGSAARFRFDGDPNKNLFLYGPYELTHGGRIQTVDDGGGTLKGLELRANPTVIMGGNVGVGLNNPSTRLDVSGTIKAAGFMMPTGAVAGHVLVSNASGQGSWAPPAAVVDGHSLDAADGDPTDVVYVDDNGNVGIGTTSPLATLHVAQTNPVLFGADPAENGSRLIWSRYNGSFRAGGASADVWGWDSLGNHTFAVGHNTRAKGYCSVAMGRETSALGGYSLATGNETTASAETATAMGDVTTASGRASMAIGLRTKAESFCSTAIGRYNEGGGSPDVWNESDPVFEIGIGKSWMPGNAVTVLKNGNVGIGTHMPTERVDVNGNISVTGHVQADTVNTSNLKVTGNVQADTVNTSNLKVTGNVQADAVNTSELEVTGDVQTAGDLQVEGAYRGNIGPNNGAPFPRPAFDSGWLPINTMQSLEVTHGIGGDEDNYVVDLTQKGTTLGIHNDNVGGDNYHFDDDYYNTGVRYYDLNNSSVRVLRFRDDPYTDSVRVRIWVIQ